MNIVLLPDVLSQLNHATFLSSANHCQWRLENMILNFNQGPVNCCLWLHLRKTEKLWIMIHLFWITSYMFSEHKKYSIWNISPNSRYETCVLNWRIILNPQNYADSLLYIDRCTECENGGKQWCIWQIFKKKHCNYVLVFWNFRWTQDLIHFQKTMK